MASHRPPHHLDNTTPKWPLFVTEKPVHRRKTGNRGQSTASRHLAYLRFLLSHPSDRQGTKPASKTRLRPGRQTLPHQRSAGVRPPSTGFYPRSSSLPAQSAARCLSRHRPRSAIANPCGQPLPPPALRPQATLRRTTRVIFNEPPPRPRGAGPRRGSLKTRPCPSRRPSPPRGHACRPHTSTRRRGTNPNLENLGNLGNPASRSFQTSPPLPRISSEYETNPPHGEPLWLQNLSPRSLKAMTARPESPGRPANRANPAGWRDTTCRSRRPRSPPPVAQHATRQDRQRKSDTMAVI